MASAALWCRLLAVSLAALAAPSYAFRTEQFHDRTVASRGSEVPEGDELPSDALEASIVKLNRTLHHIIEGEGYVPTPRKLRFCITTCPGLWGQAAWRASKMRKEAEALVTARTGASGSFDAESLALVRPDLVGQYMTVARTMAWVFLKAVDTSLYQRVVMMLLGGGGAIGRYLTGLSLMGACVFERIWKEMRWHGVEMYSPTFWGSFLWGCPEDGDPLPAPFGDEEAGVKYTDGLAFVVSKAGRADPDPEEQAEEDRLWAKAPTIVQCVLKRGKLTGQWKGRLLTVSRGVLKWKRSRTCESNRISTWLDPRERSASLALLTSGAGREPVHFIKPESFDGYKRGQCIRMLNPYRKFLFCAQPGKSLVRMKEVIDIHLGILGERRKYVVAAAGLERLILGSGVADADEEAAQLQSSEEGRTDNEEDVRGLASVAQDLREELSGDGGDDLEKKPGRGQELELARRVEGIVQSGGGPLRESSLAERGAALAASASNRSDFVVLAAAISSIGVTVVAVLQTLVLCQGYSCLADPTRFDAKVPPMSHTLFNLSASLPF